MLLSYHHFTILPKWIIPESRKVVTEELKCSIQGDENPYMVLENPFDIKVVQRIIDSLHSKISVVFTCFLA